MATSSGTRAFNLKSKSHEKFFGHFNSIVCGDDPSVKKGKPHPDIFIEAASRICQDPNGLGTIDFSKCLAFEDSPTGVTAARRAGMKVVWIPDPRMDKTLFAHDENVILLDSMEGFVPGLFGLPTYDI